jgi:hypothetical protein
MYEVLLALGINAIPPGQSEESLCRKILQDNFFFNKVLARLVEAHAFEVATSLPLLERNALRDRIIPRVKVQPVEWGFISGAKNLTGKAAITATCGPESIRWNGKPGDIRAFRWHGQAVPGDIVYLYELESVNLGDPVDAALLRQDKQNQLEWAQDPKNRKLSPDEVEVNAQLAKSFPKV